jgi:2-methylisocitrate lyase-like PEP mutase family enzyme
MPTIAEKRGAFRALHERGCFVIPNPWDIGTARYLQHLGFPAIATTSSGAAWSLGVPDTAVGRDAMLAHVTAIVMASDLPVNADFESGYAASPREVGENVRMCVATGVAGISIEDSTGDRANPLYALDEAVARMRAARNAIDGADPEVMLIGRAECFLVGRTDIDETIGRLKAYAGAGADCLYAPGIRTREQIAAIVRAVAPKPVNLLVGGAFGLTVKDIADLGVRRISVGGALARAAWGGFIRAARGIAESGTFDAFADAAQFAELDSFFQEDLKRRRRAPGPA